MLCRTALVRRARTASLPAHPSSVAGSPECLLAVLEPFMSRTPIRFFGRTTSSSSTCEHHTTGLLPPLASSHPCLRLHAPVRCAGARAARYPRGCDTRPPTRLFASLAKSTRLPATCRQCAATPLALGHPCPSRLLSSRARGLSLSRARPRVRCCRARLPPLHAAISVPLVFNPPVTAAHHATAINGGHTAAPSVPLVQFMTAMSSTPGQVFSPQNPSLCLRHCCTSSLLALHPFASNICTAHRHNTRNVCSLQSISPFNAE
jgi:hypothetical protein